MGKKKSGGQRKGKNLPSDLPAELLNAGLDPESLQKMLGQMWGNIAEGPPSNSPAERGQDLAFQAYEAEDPSQRVQLARQSLQVWPDCADAYLVLGFEASDETERLKIFEDAVAAGRRAIGEPAFRQTVGNFWLALETRPLMRAMLEVSHALWNLGRHAESVEQLREMLRLNPNDNQGVRYVLLSHLLFLNQNDVAATLLGDFPEDSAADWLYSKALLLFRRDGSTPAAKKALQAAKKSNKFVPAYLVGNQQLPEYPPEHIGVGDRPEAESYCGDALRHWRDTPGAVPWLRDTLKVPRPKAPKVEIDKRAWNRRKTKLVDLPQDQSDVWHVSLEAISDVRPVESDSELEPTSEREPNRVMVWGLVALSPTREEVIAGEFSDDKPSANEALVWLVGAMLRPDDDDPRRPGLVRVAVRSLAEAWRPKLAEVDVDCEFAEQLEDVHEYLKILRQETDLQMSARSSETLDDAGLAELPQAEEEWQLDLRLLAAFIGDRGTPRRPWTILIGDRTNEFVIAQDLITGEPPRDWLIRVVRRAMSAPSVGTARRPLTIQVATVKQRDDLESWLEQLQVRCVISENLDFLDFLYADITRHLAGEGSPPGILTVPGVQPEQAAGVFDAASEFYRAMPWRTVPADAPIKIESSAFQSGPWYAIVMGQGGMLQGIALYEDRNLLRKMLAGRMTNVESRRQNTALAVYFGEAFDIPAADLHDLERLGWQIAGPEAYPTLLRVNPGMNVRRPLAWELKLLEAGLRAVMDFVKHAPSESVNYDIPTSAGPVPLTLAWSR